MRLFKADSRSGKRKLNPCSSNFFGTTRVPVNKSSLDSSFPKMMFSTNAGSGKIVGRRIAFPIPFVNSEFVTGVGAVVLIGPSREGSLMPLEQSE